MSTTASAQRHARSRRTPPGTFEPPDGLVCRPPLDRRGAIRIGLLLRPPGRDVAEIVEPRDGAFGSEALGRWDRGDYAIAWPG